MFTTRIAKIVLLVVAVVVTGFVVRELNDPQRPYRESGKYEMFEMEEKAAPPFSAKVLGEDRVFTRDDVDRPTLFVFFATFCPHCKDQMPIVRQLHEQLGERAHVFAVNGREYGNMPDEEREKRVAAYLAENQWADIPTLIAPTQMQAAFKLGAVPSVVLMDRSGKIRYVGMANHSAARLTSLLQEAM